MAVYAMTGGATGIGAAIKQQLRDGGHRVIVVDLKDADIIADLSSTEGRQQAVAAVIEEAGGELAGLVTCAGVGSHLPNHPLIAEVNYYGSVELIEGLRDTLSANKAPVVLISSNSAGLNKSPDFVQLLLDGERAQVLAASEGIGAQEVYSGTKQALSRWMRRNTPAYASAGIRLNAVAPGYTETPLNKQVEQDPTYGEAVKQYKASIPVGFAGQPEDQADAVCFLLSEQARFIAGSVLYVDGGHDAMFRPESF